MSVSHASVTDAALTALANGQNRDPFAVLGPHRDASGRGLVIRTFQPAARAVDVRLPDGDLVPMSRRAPPGAFEAVVGADVQDYRLRVTYFGDHVVEFDDPYRYGRVLTDFDLHLLGEGTHNRAFEKLGAHRLTIGSTTGVHFAVWAPNAERVSLVGDFNGWDGRVHPMRLLLPNGIWELFVPDLAGRREIQVRDPHPSGRPARRRAIPSASRSKCRRSPRQSSGTSPATTGATTTG